MCNYIMFVEQFPNSCTYNINFKQINELLGIADKVKV